MDDFWQEHSVRGAELNAYAVCPRKCWWLQRQLTMEPHSGLVALGKLLHQEQIERYAEEEGVLTEIEIEGFARVDQIAHELVYEIKRSKRMEHAHRLQLLYYLLLLRERGMEFKGVLLYPEQNRRQLVELTPENLAQLQQALAAVQQLRQYPLPPPVPKPMAVCRTCAYQELCWCDEEDTE